MATLIPMPKWGMTMQEGTIGTWLKTEGDQVEAGEDIVEIESDKAIQLVESPASGILARILVAAGETVPITTPIAVIADEGEEVSEELIASATVAVADDTPVTPSPQSAPTATPSPPRKRGGRVPASPAAKRLAREHDIDLGTISASGPDGLIVVEDVQAAIQDAATPAGPVSTIAFYCRGTRLEGRLYLPDTLFQTDAPTPVDAPSLPGVILCLGYTYTQDLLVPEMARQLAQAGRACLVFDYRGFGRSGDAASAVRPWDQVEDIRAAVSFLAERPEVDSSRITLLGISLGGSHAVATAALDPRITAIATISAAADFRRVLEASRNDDSWSEFLDRVHSDRATRARGGEGEIVDAWDIIQPDKDSRAFLDALYGEFPHLACQLSLETADALMGYAPELTAGETADRPVLLIHGENDELVSPSESESLATAIGDSARLITVPDMAHFDWARPGDSRYEKVLETIDAWLAELDH
ncbi:MAG: alpha/beta fold hydrolase [Planctomycetota bacterium]|nr:alpha/beta fold hydrolase [Planctomycetota bacterium]